jgi:hypothetical protein
MAGRDYGGKSKMDNNLRDIAISALNRLSDIPISNYTKLIEGELDFWCQSIFPRLEERNIPIYKFVCENILYEAGYTAIDEKKLREKVYRVRQKRLKLAPVYRPDALAPLSVAGVVAASHGIENPIQAPQVKPGSNAVKVAPAIGVKLPKPLLDGLDGISWAEQSARLKSEKLAGWQEAISPLDVQMVTYFDNIRQTQHMGLKTLIGNDGIKISDRFLDLDMKACFFDLRRKYEKHGLKLSVYE